MAETYREEFAGIGGVRFYTEPGFAQSNYWLNVLLLEKGFANQRDSFLDATNSQGILTRPARTLMHELKMYKTCSKMDSLDSAKDIEQRLINIPSSANLGGAHG